MGQTAWITALAGRFSCRKEEKMPVFQTVKRVIDYIRLVRKDGLLALTDIMEAANDPFLKSCLRYILEVSAEPEDFEEYGTICMSVTTDQGARLLQKAVLVDGLLLLLKQTPPRAALLRLAAWLGEDFSEEIEAELDAMEETERQQHREIRESRAASVVPQFDALAELPPARFLQLAEKTDSQLFAIALMGASETVYATAKQKLPPEHWDMLEQQMDALRFIRSRDIEYAQKQILQFLSEQNDPLQKERNPVTFY